MFEQVRLIEVRRRRDGELDGFQELALSEEEAHEWGVEPQVEPGADQDSEEDEPPRFGPLASGRKRSFDEDDDEEEDFDFDDDETETAAGEDEDDLDEEFDEEDDDFDDDDDEDFDDDDDDFDDDDE